MVRKFKTVAFAGALMMVASPVFAQELPLIGNLNLPVVSGLDLDPMHIFTPAPEPAAAPAPMMKKHHMMKHHMMKKKMMMKKKKMMMMKK